MDGQQQGSDQPTQQFQPGETVSPRTEVSAPTPAPTTSTPEPAPLPVASAASEPVDQSPAPATQPTQPTIEPSPIPPSPFQEPAPEVPSEPSQAIAWTASEFVEHSKSSGWHMLVVGLSVVVGVGAWLVTKDIVTAVVIITAGILLSVYGARRPQQLDYRLSDQGLDVGQRHYNFNEFKSFSIVPESAMEVIMLTPIKRFAPLVSVYYDPKDEESIMNLLGSHLPHQERQADSIDSFLNRIRF
ncbi:hypothetical protein KDA23_00800 [Candidatus Saccharibacteria bacterium]|nr:hypothetical protein [Candidatus Saccharibacteria bacterium]